MKKILSSCTILLIIFLYCNLDNSNVLAQENSNNYTIVLKQKEDLEQVAKQIKGDNVNIEYSIPEIGVFQVKIAPNQLNDIKSNHLIDTYSKSMKVFNSDENFENNYLKEENSTFWDSQWDMKKVTNNGESYKLFQGTKKVTVGIIDTGLDINHSDLKANIVSGSKNLVPKGGFNGEEVDETGDINQLTDFIGHGTYTAGQIAGNGKIKGVAPGIGIRSYRVFGNLDSEAIWTAKAIVEAAKDNVDVINLSLGGYLVNGTIYSSDGKSKQDLADIKSLKKAINFAKKRGSIVVAAAGNDALDVADKKKMSSYFNDQLKASGISFEGKILDVPAELSNVVTVASTGPTDELSLFSNYGNGFIDIAAPGGDNRLLEKFGFEEWLDRGYMEKEEVLSTTPNEGYSYAAGTSVSTPKVSGALALIIDKNHFKDKPNKALNFLYKNGVTQGRTDKEFFGHGILDVNNALMH
ncbi:S8 family peptidase [Priestia aryabhattai]